MGQLPEYTLELRPSCVSVNQANGWDRRNYRSEGQTRQKGVYEQKQNSEKIQWNRSKAKLTVVNYKAENNIGLWNWAGIDKAQMRIFVHEGVYPWGVIEGFKVIKWYDQTQILNGFSHFTHSFG